MVMETIEITSILNKLVRNLGKIRLETFMFLNKQIVILISKGIE